MYYAYKIEDSQNEPIENAERFIRYSALADMFGILNAKRKLDVLFCKIKLVNMHNVFFVGGCFCLKYQKVL